MFWLKWFTWCNKYYIIFHLMCISH